MKYNIYDYSFEIDGPHQVESRTEDKLKQLARRIIDNRRFLFTILHLDAIIDSKEGYGEN
jgi:hypothetical protein